MPLRARRTLAVVAALGAMITGCDDSTRPRGPGSIYVSSSVDLVEPATSFFEYEIAVDSGTPRAMSVFEDATFIVNGLAHGNHLVEILGIPSTCNAGGNKRPVTLEGEDTVLVVYTVTCARTTGDLRVNVTTTGPEPDADGYIITYDGFAVAYLPSNGGVTLSFVPVGPHTIGLTGVAANCTVPPTQTATFTAGVLITMNFTVTCVQSATVRVIATASGTDPDPDRAMVKIGAAAPMRVAPGTSYIKVPAGSQNWELSDIQPNCTVASTTGSFSAAVGDTVTIDATETCTDIGYGVAGTGASDPAGDTLSNTSDPDKAHDLLQVNTRYATGFIILVLRTATPVGAVGLASPAGLQGYIELDTDESTATGFSPIINAFGGNAQQGVDWGVILFLAEAGSVVVERASSTADTTTHLVPIKLEGDSVIIKIPLAKLGGDDGRMSITMVVGDDDRPTDIAPNSGQILARPAAPLRAGVVASPAPKSTRVPPTRDIKWGRPAPKPLVQDIPR
jgi:hypothetical protein